MREILFKAKKESNGEWIEGYVYIMQNGEYRICKYSKYTNIECLAYDVIPETVCQYTGLTDKNGKKIFEGDIVKVVDEYGDTDFCDGGIGDVCFYDGMWYVAGQVQNSLFDLSKCYYIEVIGNRWDNPELLEVQEK